MLDCKLLNNISKNAGLIHAVEMKFGAHLGSMKYKPEVLSSGINGSDTEADVAGIEYAWGPAPLPTSVSLAWC
jgi:hypothetical protein